MSGPARESGGASRAERLFADYLTRVEVGEEVQFESFRAEHPSCAEELDSLYQDWQRLQSVLSAWPRPGLSPTQSVLERYGLEVDPGVSLENEGPASQNVALGDLAVPHGPAHRYRRKGEVARGGMGAILRVWDADLRRNLAMKVLLGPGSSQDTAAADLAPHQVSRFLEEAQVTAQLDHPGIVPVHELGLDAQGRIYFTMKLVRGRDLREVTLLARRGEEGWNRGRVLEVLLRVCDALAYAHDKGVVHRDVKPANVMVGKFGEVYLMDWGLARVAGPGRGAARPPSELATLSEIRTARKDAKESGDPTSPLVTLDGTVVGTPYFMSPEQAAGHLDGVGPATDVYGVGTLLYQLLTGVIPYFEKDGRLSPHTVLARVLNGPPAPIETLEPEAPPELVAICNKAMARSLDERYGTAAELALDLRSYLEGRVVPAFEKGRAAELRKWVARNRPLAATVATAAVLLLVGSLTWSLVLAGKNRDLAAASRESRRLEAVAREERAEALRQRDEVLRLSDGERVQALRLAADEELWPAGPGIVAGLVAWLEKAAALEARLPTHVAALEELRAQALPWSPAEREADREQQARRRARRRAELATHDEYLQQGVDSFLPEELADAGFDTRAPMDHREHRDLHAGELAALAREDFEIPRRTWSFGDARTAWRHQLLADLIDGIRGLSEPFGGRVADVEARLALSRELEQQSVGSPAAAEAWAHAAASIADEDECPAYGGLELVPIVGLLPLGRDPRSGLWEFAHLASGEPARRGLDGRLRLEVETGIVLVLLPGGAFWQGAQPDEPDGRNYDPHALVREQPVHQVELDPFFLAKHEVTQHQWIRLEGDNPSTFYVAGLQQLFTHQPRLNPVESIDWHRAKRACERWGLSLPTEAQWEYACRSGTDTPWYTGDDPLRLSEFENLADRRHYEYWRQSGDVVVPLAEVMPYDDESSLHTNVGVYLANHFGLHDMLGNVAEWCLDAVRGDVNDPYGAPRPGDGLRGEEFAVLRIVRGGNHYDSNHVGARCAARSLAAPGQIDSGVGVRAALSLRP